MINQADADSRYIHTDLKTRAEWRTKSAPLCTLFAPCPNFLKKKNKEIIKCRQWVGGISRVPVVNGSKNGWKGRRRIYLHGLLQGKWTKHCIAIIAPSKSTGRINNLSGKVTFLSPEYIFCTCLCSRNVNTTIQKHRTLDAMSRQSIISRAGNTFQQLQLVFLLSKWVEQTSWMSEKNSWPNSRVSVWIHPCMPAARSSAWAVTQGSIWATQAQF